MSIRLKLLRLRLSSTTLLSNVFVSGVIIVIALGDKNLSLIKNALKDIGYKLFSSGIEIYLSVCNDDKFLCHLLFI